MKLNIEIDNLTESQAVAIEEYLAVWQFIGKEKDMSLWTSFFADGLRDFAPEIKVNGKDPERCMLDIGLRLGKVHILQTDESPLKQNMYFIDYLKIQDALTKDEDTTE
jgi:hypothetical protein